LGFTFFPEGNYCELFQDCKDLSQESSEGKESFQLIELFTNKNLQNVSAESKNVRSQKFGQHKVILNKLYADMLLNQSYNPQFSMFDALPKDGKLCLVYTHPLGIYMHLA